MWEENFRVYGARKLWKQLNRERCTVARCTVERLMRALGLRGAARGRRVRTTLPAAQRACVEVRANRVFRATRPNASWVADLTYVATWRGLVYVAFVIDAFVRRIVGWRVSNSLRSDLALDAPEQALYDRQIDPTQRLVHHSDRGVRHLSIRYTERLAEAGIEPSVGRVGNSDDNALAETISRLYKTEVIRQRSPWRHLEAIELATLQWVEWFNHPRLFEPIGDLTPVEKQEFCFQEWAKVA